MFHQMQKELKAAKKKQKRKNRKYESLDINNATSAGYGEVNIEGIVDGKVKVKFAEEDQVQPETTNAPLSPTAAATAEQQPMNPENNKQQENLKSSTKK